MRFTREAFAKAAREHAASRRSAGTRALYEADLARWLDFCKEPHRPSLHAATAFRDELQTKLAPQTVRRILSGLSSMYEHVMGREKPLATWNPFKALPRPPATAYTRTEAFSADEAERIIAAAQNADDPQAKRDAAILRLLYDTGLRRSSVAQMRTRDLHLRDAAEGGAPNLVVQVALKGGKVGEVVLTKAAGHALISWQAAQQRRGVIADFIFPARKGKGAINDSAINKIVTARAKQAGVADAHPHRFRATFVTEALDAGLPLHEVQAAVHHNDPNTTLRYDRGRRGAGVSTAVAAHREKKK